MPPYHSVGQQPSLWHLVSALLDLCQSMGFDSHTRRHGFMRSYQAGLRTSYKIENVADSRSLAQVAQGLMVAARCRHWADELAPQWKTSAASASRSLSLACCLWGPGDPWPEGLPSCFGVWVHAGTHPGPKAYPRRPLSLSLFPSAFLCLGELMRHKVAAADIFLGGGGGSFLAGTCTVSCKPILTPWFLGRRGAFPAVPP